MVFDKPFNLLTAIGVEVFVFLYRYAFDVTFSFVVSFWYEYFVRNKWYLLSEDGIEGGMAAPEGDF